MFIGTGALSRQAIHRNRAGLRADLLEAEGVDGVFQRSLVAKALAVVALQQNGDDDAC